MPGKDGTGPLGQGPGAGRGAGRRGQRGQRGQQGAIGVGPTGYCICPKCGEKTTHTAGVPCTSTKCPKCGTFMIRDS